jgi:hypothetical protein
LINIGNEVFNHYYVTISANINSKLALGIINPANSIMKSNLFLSHESAKAIDGITASVYNHYRIIGDFLLVMANL